MKSIVLPFLLAAAVAGAQPLMIQPEYPVMAPRTGLPSMYQAPMTTLIPIR